MMGLNATEKTVFDLPGACPIAGIRMISNVSSINPNAYDCVLCAQTLEHCSDPGLEMRRMREVLKPGGILYLELPDEHWEERLNAGPIANAARSTFIKLSLRSELVHKVLDLLFTDIRKGFGWLPSLGFVPMREHINYFSLKSMRVMCETHGLKVIASEKYNWIVARKVG